VQKVFQGNTFLWVFVVAWSKSEKTGDQGFIKGQCMAMNSFDKKHGVVAMGVDLRLGAAIALALAVTESAPPRGQDRAQAPASEMETAWAIAPPPAVAPAAPAPAPGWAKQPYKKPQIRAIEQVPRPVAVEEAPGPATRIEQAEPSGSTAWHQAKALSWEMHSWGSAEEEATQEPETDANAVMEQKKDTSKKARVPHHGSQRSTPCSQCACLCCDCYEQVNGKTACYHCGRSKLQCDTGDVGQVVKPKKGKAPARRQAKKVPSSGGEEPLWRRFTQKEKGKSKGEFYIS